MGEGVNIAARLEGVAKPGTDSARTASMRANITRTWLHSLAIQIVGAATTPALCIAFLSSSLATNALASFTEANSWVTVTSVGSSAAW